MIFVIPMAGDSLRFRDAGYLRPKFRLMAHGAPVFDHAVRSFAAYFRDDTFLFAVRGEESARFVEKRCEALGMRRAAIVALDSATAGQADTVLRALEQARIDSAESIAIFNIDTFRPGYRKPPVVDDRRYAGYLEVFRGSGSGWSFVAPDPLLEGDVTEVVEKEPISTLCSTGLYFFRHAGDFRWAYNNPAPPRSSAERRERFVAPLYNALIARGDRVALQLIDVDEVIFCGTPVEYEQVLASDNVGQRLRATA